MQIFFSLPATKYEFYFHLKPSNVTLIDEKCPVFCKPGRVLELDCPGSMAQKLEHLKINYLAVTQVMGYIRLKANIILNVTTGVPSDFVEL